MLVVKINNNMNSTLVNNVTQPLNISYTLIQPVILSKQVIIETL